MLKGAFILSVGFCAGYAVAVTHVPTLYKGYQWFKESWDESLENTKTRQAEPVDPNVVDGEAVNVSG